MPIKFKVNCNVCKKLKGNPRLVKRIYASKEYIRGGETLLHIAEEEGMNYGSLRSHCKKHQALSEEKLAEAEVQQIARRVEANAVKTYIKTGEARQTVMDRLADKLQGIDLDNLSERDVIALLLKATKDSDDVTAKKRDQDVDILKMMGSVRSGEISHGVIDAPFDPWTEEGLIVESTT